MDRILGIALLFGFLSSVSWMIGPSKPIERSDQHRILFMIQQWDLHRR